MQRRHAVLTLILLAGGACSDRQVLTEPAPQALAPSFAWSETEYPTHEEYQQNTNNAGPYMTLTTPDVGFGSSTFDAWAMAEFTWVNVVSGSLTVRLIDDNGANVNSGNDSFSSSAYRPQSSLSRGMFATAGTLGRTCGLTGKSTASASSALKLLGNDGPYIFWTGSLSRDGSDVSQGACEPPPPCDAMGPGGCDPDDGGGGGGGGDYEEECYRCQQWLYYENGEVVDEWWECTQIDPSYCRAS